MKPGAVKPRAAAISALLVAPALVLVAAACNGELRFDDADGSEGGAPAGPHACRADGDCRLATLHCDLRSATCVECTDDTHCTQQGLPRCDVAQHRCVACGVQADCLADDRCDTVTQRCRHPCADDGPCPPAIRYCNELRGFCGACHDDDDCLRLSPDTPLCDTTAGTCVRCRADTNCPSDAPRCDRISGRCVRCITTTDCAADRVCDPLTHACL